MVKKALAIGLACALALAGLILWALDGSVAWSVHEIVTAGMALVLVVFAVCC